MQHISINAARKNFDGFLDAVIENSDVISIATDKGAAILINADEWNELLRIKHNVSYTAMLDRSLKQAENGDVIVKSLDELEELVK